MGIIPNAKGKITMKIKQISIIIAFVLLGILLSGCTNANATNSWGSAVVAGDNVIFTNSTGVVALSTLNGSSRWTYPEKAAATRLFFAAPAISTEGKNGDEQVIIGDYSGLLVSISNNDGKTEYWRFAKAQGKYIASPIIVDNYVIAPNTDGFVYFIEVKQDSNGWFLGDVKSYPIKKNMDQKGIIENALGGFWATPATDGTTVYLPNLNHHIYAVDIVSSQTKWEKDLGGPLVAQPYLAEDGTLYVGTLNSTLYALNSTDGSILWQKTMPGGIWSEPILKDGQLFVGDESGKLNIVKASDGSITQSIDEKAAILGRGADLGDSLVFANENGQVFAIDASGSGVWMRSLTGKIYSNLVFGGDQLYILPTKGDKPIYAYDAKGNEIWNYSVK
jgi:outer membrane protein assembly factor BamB